MTARIRVPWRTFAPWPVALALLCTATSVAAAEAPATPVAYTLAPRIVDGRLDCLAVTLRLTADTSGETDIGWESSWDGEDRLWQWARDFEVSGAIATEPRGDGRWRVRSAPGAPLTVRYRIVGAADRGPASDTVAEPDPIVRPRWFYGVGESLFAYPIDHADAPARFEWAGAPAGFGFASDLQHAALADGATVSDVLESVAIGGWPLHVTGAIDHGDGVRVATIGDFAFNGTDFDAAIKGVVDAERDFWGQHGRAPMLVTAISLRHADGNSSSMGTGRGDAFAMWIDETAPLDSMIWLLGHEYFHHWNPARLGSLADPEAADYWLSEGFTDYYARALLLRAGIVTNEQFAAQWNHMLNRYARTDDRGIGNADMAARYYADGSLHDLPYYRGAMLAATWNRKLRAASGGRWGLDDVMRSMAASQAKQPERELVDAFTAAAARFGLDVRGDIRRHIAEGEPLTLAPGTFGPCTVVEPTAVADFDLGFDYAATGQAHGRITGVAEASAAYAAGLRDGMMLIAILSADSRDSSVPVTLRVSDGQGERTIAYQPAGVTSSLAEQLGKVPSSDVCAASLSGL